MTASTFVMVVAFLDGDVVTGRDNPSAVHEEVNQLLGRHVSAMAGMETGIGPELFVNGLQKVFHRVSVVLHHFQNRMSVYHSRFLKRYAKILLFCENPSGQEI